MVSCLLRTRTDWLLGLFFLLLNVPSASACPDIDGLPDFNCDGSLIIVTFGNSITAGVGDNFGLGGYPGRLARDLPNSTVINVGISGERTNRGRARASSVFAQAGAVDYAIILEGVNDYWNRWSARTTAENVLAIANAAQSVGAVTLIGSLTHTLRSYQQPWVLAVNSELRPYVSLDFFSLGAGIMSRDLLHPDGPGYEVMAAFARTRLAEVGVANRPLDSDADGLYDFKEQELGSSTSSADTDGDKLSDGEEFGAGSSPLVVDTDGDGLSDFEEVRVYGSNPASKLPGAPTIQQIEVLPN